MFVITNLKQRKQNTSSSSAPTKKDSFSIYFSKDTNSYDRYLYVYIYTYAYTYTNI